MQLSELRLERTRVRTYKNKGENGTRIIEHAIFPNHTCDLCVPDKINVKQGTHVIVEGVAFT